MYDEAKQIIAVVFTRSGKQKLLDSEMYLIISMDLQWCSPNIAKDFVANACFLGSLKKEGNNITPSFNVRFTAVPLSFHPTEKMFHIASQEDVSVPEQKKAQDFLIERLQRKTSLDGEQIQNKINKIVEEKQLHIASASALLARSYDVDFVDILKALKEEMQKENKS